MKRIGIVGENYQNDACALGLLMTPQYKDTMQLASTLKTIVQGFAKQFPFKKFIKHILANAVSTLLSSNLKNSSCRPNKPKILRGCPLTKIDNPSTTFNHLSSTHAVLLLSSLDS